MVKNVGFRFNTGICCLQCWPVLLFSRSKYLTSIFKTKEVRSSGTSVHFYKITGHMPENDDDTEDINLHHHRRQNPKFTSQTLFHCTSNCNITNVSMYQFPGKRYYL